jgi:hypothetical protein
MTPSSLHLVYMEATERQNYPYYIILRYAPPKVTLGNLVVAPLDRCPATAPCLAWTQTLQSLRVLSTSKSPEAHIAHQSDWCSSPVRLVPTGQTGQLLQCFGLLSWLCVSTKDPSGFVVNHWKPCGLGVASRQSPLMTWPHIFLARPWF